MSDSDDNGLPDWVSKHTVSYLNLIKDSDSDEEAAPPQPSQAGPSQQPPAPTASLPPQASQLPPADSQQRRATPISQAKPSQLRRGKQQQPQPSSSHQADSKAQQDGMLYMASQVGQSATPLGTQQPASLAGAGGGVLPAVAVVGGAGAGATPSSVPLVLPEKLNKHKVLMELPARGTRRAGGDEAQHMDSALDLSGDAGAVGRVLIVPGPGGSELPWCLRVDLKGTLYNASVLPLAGTAMVVHIGGVEAKVEALVNDFVRLVEDEAAAGEELQEGTLDGLFDADDENYQMPGGGEGDGAKPKKPKKKRGSGDGEGGEGGGSGKAKKKLQGTKAGGVKKKVAKKAKPASGGGGKPKVKPAKKAKS